MKDERSVASMDNSEFQSVVSSAWLYEHLSDQQIAIADCRFSLTEPALGRQQYQTSHIPGAYYLDLDRKSVV